MTEGEAAAYLAAFIDGEGHIGCHMTARHRSMRTIEFTNTDKQLFDNVVVIAASIGLKFHVSHRKSQKEHWADRYTARLANSPANFQLFKDLIPLQAERKRAALEEILGSYVGSETLEALYASRRTSIARTCPVCKNEFFAFPADIKRGSGIHCSMKCAGIGRSVKNSVNCETCSSVFHVNSARKETARFCSQRCSGVAKSDRLRAQATKASNARWHPERNQSGS